MGSSRNRAGAAPGCGVSAERDGRTNHRVSQDNIMSDAQRAAVERSQDPRPHGVLGVPVNADEAMLRKAYRAMAKLLHPDKCKLQEAEASFKRVK